MKRRPTRKERDHQRYEQIMQAIAANRAQLLLEVARYYSWWKKPPLRVAVKLVGEACEYGRSFDEELAFVIFLHRAPSKLLAHYYNKDLMTPFKVKVSFYTSKVKVAK